MTLQVEMRHAFDGFDLDVTFEAPSGVTVLFGPSGSGKTSVLRAVAGLFAPDFAKIAHGSDVLIDTEHRVTVPPHRRRIGFIFQDDRLFPHMTVRQNLTYGARFASNGPSADTARIVDMLGLGDLLSRRPAALSGGEKQRVAIGRALLARPRLILADEPLASLDEPRKAEILPYFERLAREVETPILYVTHAVTELARLADQVVAMQAGRVVRAGSASDVMSDPEGFAESIRSVGSLLRARVVKHHEDGLTELDAGGTALFLPRIALAIGETARLRVAAHDVILARTRPTGLSALNILAGEVRSIRAADGAGTLVSLETPAGLCLARITKRSLAALNLRQGDACFAIIKTVAIAPDHITSLSLP